LTDTRARSKLSVTEFGVTRERIRQIEAKALRKLKQFCHSKNLQRFLDEE